MKKFFSKYIKKDSNVLDSMFFVSLKTLFLFFVGTTISTIVFVLFAKAEIYDYFNFDEDIFAFLLQYLSFIGIWLMFFVAVLINKKSRPLLTKLKFDISAFKGFLYGILFGFLCNGFCGLMSIILGDIKIAYDHFNPVLLLLFFIAVIIQSGAEEIMCRCFIYQMLRRRYNNPWVAVIYNSLFFTVMHLGNEGVNILAIVQIFFVGLLFSLFIYYYDNLWLAIGFHAAWNFMQNIILGLTNSGIVSKYSLFYLQAASANNGLFYNVNFGIEGSLGSLLVLVLACVVVYLINMNKPEKNNMWDINKEVIESD